jgi:hypothetical protein
MDREGLRIVPEAAPDPEDGAGQPSASGVPAGTAPGDRATASVRRGTFRALRSRPFRLYFAGQVASASGTFVQQTAIGWLVLRLTGSAAELGLVLAAGGVPSLLFGPWGRDGRRPVSLRGLLIVTQTAYGVLGAALLHWPSPGRRPSRRSSPSAWPAASWESSAPPPGRPPSAPW